MSNFRYEKISQYLCLNVLNTQTSGNSEQEAISKLLPLFELANKNFQMHCHIDYNISIDDSLNDTDLNISSLQPQIQYIKTLDLSNRTRRMFSCGMESRENWRNLLWFIIDSCRTNAWIIYKSCKKVDRYYVQKDFILDVGKELIGTFTSLVTSLGRLGLVPMTRQPLHSYCRLHTARRICKGCSKKKRRKQTVFGCPICNVHFCLDCFKEYHPSTRNVTEPPM